MWCGQVVVEDDKGDSESTSRRLYYKLLLKRKKIIKLPGSAYLLPSPPQRHSSSACEHYRERSPIENERCRRAWLKNPGISNGQWEISKN